MASQSDWTLRSLLQPAMDPARQSAYRYLIYWALVEIRLIQGMGSPSLLSPWRWRTDLARIRFCGAVADWLHNVAYYSSRDFEGFNEDQFWEDYARLCTRFPEYDPGRFRNYFDLGFEIAEKRRGGNE